jgi:hypothetical protein
MHFNKDTTNDCESSNNDRLVDYRRDFDAASCFGGLLHCRDGFISNVEAKGAGSC